MWPYDEIYFKGIHLDRYNNHNSQSLWNSVTINDYRGCQSNYKSFIALLTNKSKFIFSLIANYYQLVRLKKHLYGLSDHLLDDIGIERSNIEAAISGSHYRGHPGKNKKAIKNITLEVTAKRDPEYWLTESKKIAA